MKKLFLFIIMIFLLLPFRVDASNFNTSISGNKTIYAGEQFTITFSVSNANNLMGIVGRLSYDSSKLSIVNSSGLNGFNLTLGSNIVCDSSNGKNGSFSFASITFKATANFNVGQSTTISFSNVVGSDGTSDLSGSSSAINISMIAPKSTNNYLSSLTVNDNLVSGFNSNKTSYSLTVNNDVSSVNIKATTADNKSSVSGTGTKKLNVYSNTFSIVVIAENGSKRTYTITIIRKDKDGRTAPLSTNNLLSSLVVTGYNLDFKPENTNYNLTVENNVSKVEIIANPQDNKSKIEIGDASNLKIGDNIINITVTAENGDKKIYTLVIKRKNEGPTTTIAEVLNILDSTTSKTINIDINDNNTIITTDILKALKNKNKQVVVSYYQNDIISYKWEINGSNIRDYQPIDTLISYNSNNHEKIAKLTNYADNFYLSFAYNGDLPKDTYVSIYVANKYADGSKVNLYYYDNSHQTINKVYDNLVVENGYIKFKIEHCSEYILSMADYNITTENVLLYKIIIVVLASIIVCMLSSKLYLYRKGKKDFPIT